MKIYPPGSECGCYYDDETKLAHICLMHYNEYMNNSELTYVAMDSDLVTEPSVLSEIFGIPVYESKPNEESS